MLEIQNLDFRYQYRRILSKLSFQVRPGEILHIQGPNGCGKTTLMSIIAGLRHEESGSIHYRFPDGRALPDRREVIEYLPAEANALFGKMDAMDNLRFWRRLRGLSADDSIIRAALATWDLDRPLVREHFPVERFSTGMKRRLALARLQLAEAPCWLLDEPLYGLDVKGIASFQALLEGHLKHEGMALIVSHDVAPLERFAIRRLDLSGESKR